MTQRRPLQRDHSQADLIWPDLKLIKDRISGVKNRKQIIYFIN